MADDVPRMLAGRYEVGELIGRGGMAEVHIGRDNRLSRTVAIKMLRADLARDPSFHARFRREAQSAASLNHPGIVSVYDTGEETFTLPNGAEVHAPFIIMEYVEGHTVRDLLRDGSALPIDEAVEITAGILAALEYSHHAGIVHRDIKPANVMLTPAGAVKVMDFGIARAMADSAATMTQAHAVVGTAQYLSPEQARGEVVDARSDLYSTGCLLYELLTGRPPFIGDSAVAVAYQHVSEEAQPPSAHAPDVPEALDRIVMKALVKDREQRYSNAAEFRSDLEAAEHNGVVGAPALGALAAGAAGAAGGPGGPATQVFGGGSTAVAAPTTRREVQEGAEPERRSNRALLWVLALIGIAAAIGIAFLLMNRETEPPPPTTVSVPDLTGLDEAGVNTALTAAELQADIQEPAADPTIPAGTTVSWTPETGTEVQVDSIVEVTLSAGPDVRTIPDVEGMSQDRARETLSGADFTNIRTSTENDPSHAADEAIRTEPGANEDVAPDTEITIILGTGNVNLPDLTGQTLEEAQQILTDLNLTAVITFRDDAGPVDVVLTQNRTDLIPIRSQVEIVISQAEPTPEPTTVTVPDLAGLDEAGVNTALTAAGLQADFQEPVTDPEIPAGTTVSWTPETGTEVQVDSTVEVTLSAGVSG